MRDPESFLVVLNTALEIANNYQRGTGRTHDMIAMIKDGDVVIIAPWERAELERSLRVNGIFEKVRLIANEPSKKSLLNEEQLMGLRGRTVFSHEWLLEFYRAGIASLDGNLMYLSEYIGRDKEPTPRVYPPSRYK